MSLFLATLLPGLFLILVGGVLLWNNPRVATTAKALPRSEPAAWVFFGTGAAWFIWRVSTLNESDLIVASSPMPLMVGFAIVAVLSFFCTPDFLAVRGLCVLMLMAAEPLLRAAYMEWDHPQRLLMVTVVYVGVAAAIYLGASPFRLRDFFEWLFGRPGRAKWLGAALLAYGTATSAAAFTY